MTCSERTSNGKVNCSIVSDALISKNTFQYTIKICNNYYDKENLINILENDQIRMFRILIYTPIFQRITLLFTYS